MAFAGTIELDEDVANASVGTTKPLADLGVGAALWEASAGSWSMIDCGCIDGYEPGPAPTEPVKYDGQILKKLCQPVAG